MKKRSQTDVRKLLELLGADPDESIPTDFKEARLLHKSEHKTSPPRHTHKKCTETGKTMYLSETMAKQAAKSRLNKGSNVSKLRQYKCEHCHHWHMSSTIH